MHNGDYYDDHGRSDAAGWSAFLAGAFIGAGLALLFAPQTGNELRGILRNYPARTKDDVMDRGREAWDTAVDRGQQYVERGQEIDRVAGLPVLVAARTGRSQIDGFVELAAREPLRADRPVRLRYQLR